MRLKNLQTAGGVSLLTRAIHLAKLAGLEDVTVSTDHPAIAFEAIRSVYLQTSLLNYNMPLNFTTFLYLFKAERQFSVEVKLQHPMGLHRFGEQRNFFPQEPIFTF